jgi:hypothetical protein
MLVFSEVLRSDHFAMKNLFKQRSPQEIFRSRLSRKQGFLLGPDPPGSGGRHEAVRPYPKRVRFNENGCLEAVPEDDTQRSNQNAA